ncbi:MAG TPA: chitobiase/beta-hexosaminidase C-terminal domain-containing protein, partial [Candidatus Acidoferrum sp.]
MHWKTRGASVVKRGLLLLALSLLWAGYSVAQTSIVVSIAPQLTGLTVGQAISVTATVANDAQNQGVTWSATGGSFSASATASGVATSYTAPASAGVYTVTATSVTDVTKSASVTFGVTDLAGVFTYHNNLSRDGSNPSEYALTPSNVSSTTFGKLFSCTVDGAIYAQPLWVANLTVGGVNHNVVIVATQHDSLYAFDADVNTSPCTPLWHVSLIDAAHGGSSSESTVPSGTTGNLVGSGFGDITPEVGVTGTPVIDPTSHTLYVVSKSVITSGPTFYQRLHAIDLTTGNEKTGSPITIAGTYPGTGDGGTKTTFSPRQQNQRPGLALVNGVVYIAWASHEDTVPYYGWVMGYNASNLSQAAVLNISPNVGHGGIWMGGAAPSADSSNNLYLITGNANFDATNTTAPNNDYGDSFLKLTSGLAVSQYFTPSDQSTDNSNDNDFGAGGAAILVDQPTGPVQHLVIGGGKDGYLYLLNRDAMGGLGDSNAWQRFNFGYGIFDTGAFWNDTFYMAGINGPLQAYTFNTTTGKFNTANISRSSATFAFPGSTPSVSSSGTTNGIVWALNNGNYCTSQSPGCGAAVLHAYDATNLATELWNSTMGTANTAGNAVKFTVPTVANGKVYVGTRGNNTGGSTSSSTIPGELDVYGLLHGPAQAATPTFNPPAGTYAGSRSVSINDATSGATIYYTTNGTTPTSLST